MRTLYRASVRFLIVAWLWHADVAIGAYDFARKDNRIPWVDANGRLSIWVDEGWTVPISNNESIPFRFQFCSMQDFIANGCMGEGWWVPLLESTVVEEAETYVRLNGLGGEFVYLNKDPANSVQYISPDAKWKGVLQAGDRFEVNGPDGWEFHYRMGNLASAVSPQGVKLEWVKKDGRLHEITSSETGTVLSVKYDPQNRIDRITFGDGQRLSFGYGQLPLVQNIAGVPSIQRLLPTLASIQHNQSRKMTFETVLNPDGLFETVTSGMKGNPKSTTLRWSPETSLLLQQGKFRYEVEKVNERDTYPKVSRRDTQTGKTESYHWDSVHRIERREHASGETAVLYFVGTPGPAFMKVRRLEVLNQSGAQESATSFAYDEVGRLVRKVLNGKLVKTCRYLDSAELPPTKEMVAVLSEDYKANECPAELYNTKGELVAIKSDHSTATCFERGADGACVMRVLVDGKQEIRYAMDRFGRLIAAEPSAISQ